MSAGGRDDSSGGSASAPWATLQFAADRVQPGDTVHVTSGGYAGMYLERGGSQGMPVTFRAEAADVRITSRNATTPDGINALWGTAHTEVYAASSTGKILRFDGTAWTITATLGGNLKGIWGAYNALAYAVGDGGTIVRGAP